MFAPFVKNITRHRIKFVRETIKAIEKTRGSKCWIRRIGENVEIALGNVFGSSDRRLKVGNFRPISRATPSSLRLFTTPGNLIGDGTRYTSVSRILIIHNILPFFFSLQLQRIREKLEAFFIFNASRVRNGERSGIRKFRKLRKLRIVRIFKNHR